MNSDKSILELTKSPNDYANVPLVSMVIPCYNHAAYVQQSIASIIAQDYANIELIIIDDGSSDESVLRIKEMAEQCRSRFVRFEFRARANKGLSVTLNEALRWINGTYFATLASDDILMPSKTSKLVECLRGEIGIAGAFGSAEVIDSQGAVIGFSKSNNRTCDFKDVFLHAVIISAPTQLLDVNALKSVGGFIEGMYIEDWSLWLKLTGAGYKLKCIEDTLVRYRQHDSNISKNVIKMLECRLLILEKYRKYPDYEFALSQAYAAAALEYSGITRLKSIAYLIESIRCSPRIIFEKGIIFIFIKLILPVRIINSLKKTPHWLQSYWNR